MADLIFVLNFLKADKRYLEEKSNCQVYSFPFNPNRGDLGL